MRTRILSLSVLFAALILVPSSMYAQGQTPPPPAKPAAQPKLVAGSEILIDRNTDTGKELIALRNDNAAPLPISLSGVVSSPKAPHPSIKFKAETDGATAGEGSLFYSAEIPVHQVIKVWAIVSSATTPGEFEVDLRNNETSFDKTLKAIRLPFEVKLDETNPQKFSMIDDVPTTVVVKNDDPASYPLIWRLSINDQEVCGDKLTLAANGLGVLQCKPSVPFGLSRLQDLFKPQDGKGTLLLYPQTPTGEPNKASPWKIIPLAEVTLSSVAPFAQQFGGYLTIVAVLLLGGLTSLLLSQALPNRLTRLNIRERLMGTARTTANLSSNVDSRLQVILRVERSRLYDLLESRNTFSPDFASVAVRCREGAAKLESRVALVQQMDVVLGQLDQALRESPPPSQIAEIEVLIGDAKVLLAKTEPTDKDLEAAQASISEAAKKVEALNQTDATFGQKLAARALSVKDDIDTNVSSKPVFKELDGFLPGPYAELRQVRAGTTEIPADEYCVVDMAIEKILLMKEYVRLRENAKEQAVQDRLMQRQGEVVSLLSRESWPAMRSARLLLREMGDDVYPERLAEVLAANGASIDIDPSVAYDKAPLEFCVCFDNKEVNESAARDEWTCEWSFGDSLKERGWTASHYFLLPDPGRFKKAVPAEFTVQATFRKPNGEHLLDAQNQPLAIERKVTVRPSRQEGFFGDRSRTELLKLLAALFIAVFALVAGAKEQLLKLDILPGLIAVFLVGFGADTIKNLLTTKSESAP